MHTLAHTQEEGNIPYVVDNGVGAFETDPGRIADTLARWLAPGNTAELRAMSSRSKRLGRPRAVYDIVTDLAELASTLGAAARLPAAAKGARCGRQGGNAMPMAA
jgi:1,2-diacylglycerol 3-beta-galactosyltransferase